MGLSLRFWIMRGTLWIPQMSHLWPHGGTMQDSFLGGKRVEVLTGKKKSN